MSRKLVLATRNPDKVQEIREAFSDIDVEILTAEDFPGMPEVVEDGNTIKENAVKKARSVADFTGLFALADDTALEIETLGGAPGVRSSRFAGEGATYADNVRKVLRLLNGIPWEQRRARFRCVMVLAQREWQQVVEGTCEGYVTFEPRGTLGFGYDPIFYLPEWGKTFAEMDLRQKNQVSHRGRALEQVKHVLESLS